MPAGRSICQTVMALIFIGLIHCHDNIAGMAFVDKGLLRFMQVFERKGCGKSRPDFSTFNIANQSWCHIGRNDR